MIFYALDIKQVKTQESFTLETENNYRSHSKTHKLIYMQGDLP